MAVEIAKACIANRNRSAMNFQSALFLDDRIYSYFDCTFLSNLKLLYSTTEC